MPASAYGVTKSGANKLLSIFDEVGNFYQWDAIMLRHAVSTHLYRKMLPYICSDSIGFYRGQRTRNAGLKISSVRLNAYAIYPPLTIHDYEAVSVKKNVPDGKGNAVAD